MINILQEWVLKKYIFSPKNLLTVKLFKDETTEGLIFPSYLLESIKLQ